MKNKVGRYSKFIKPIILIIDLMVLNCFGYLIFTQNLFSLYFIFFISTAWLIIALNLEYYKVFRFTKGIAISNKIVKQFTVFSILCFSFAGFFIKNINKKEVLFYLLYSLITISIIKFLIYYALKKYRSIFGGNYRNVITIGNSENVKLLANLLKTNFDYGCNVLKEFKIDNKKDVIDESIYFALNNDVDVIYCSTENLSKKNIDTLIDFSENNLKTVKFLPDTDEIFTRNQNIEYYDYIPVLSINKTYLDDPVTKMIKRVFDIFFSILVIVLLLSWSIPILALFIKLESNGPIFFKQGRPGFGEKEFFCYKFRSMRINQKTETEAIKNDPRVTKIGRFIRKTSIDEMPQFLNVLLGDMSVVGPRPHLWSQNKAYGKKINRYMMRHYVKPGITGLAQVKGFRGEIESDEEMKSRISYDVFYIENWSLIMDIKIIFQTVINIFKGEDKAY